MLKYLPVVRVSDQKFHPKLITHLAYTPVFKDNNHGYIYKKEPDVLISYTATRHITLKTSD